jgi:DNA-binding GntR family transcriptional regulator
MSANPLRQQAYEFIQEEIVSGHLAVGSQVSELSLARQIGISRTPVREAIGRLVHEGLLEQVPRYGTIVRTPQRRDIIELYELREALEGYAVGQAAERISANDLAMLARLCDAIKRIGGRLRRSGKRALEADMMEQFLAADLAFHMVIVRAAGNGRLLKIVSESRVLTRVIGMKRQEHTAAVVEGTYRYHSRILRALRRRDARAARELLVNHIDHSKQEALAAFDQPTLDQELVLPIGMTAELERASPKLGRKRRKE